MEIGLESEGGALESVLGDAALYIWAVGLLAAGQVESSAKCSQAKWIQEPRRRAGDGEGRSSPSLVNGSPSLLLTHRTALITHQP